MKNQFFKLTMAVGLSVTMLFSNVIPALAADGDNTITGSGTGTSTGHLDNDYIEVTLPTERTVANTFNFYVDPEDIIGKGGVFETDAVVSNNDLVYFAISSNEATQQYASTSDELEITIKSYLDANVSVVASLSGNDASTITLVDTSGNIDNSAAADDTSLWLGLKVGDNETVALSADGVSSNCDVSGQSDKFDISGNIHTSYAVTPKADQTWDSISISMAGKAQLTKNATGIVAPEVVFVFTVTLPDAAAASTAITGAYVSANQQYDLTLPDGVTLSSASDVTNLTVNGVAITDFTLNGGKNKIRINRSDIKTALGGDTGSWATTDTFTFTFTANGVSYKAENVAKNG